MFSGIDWTQVILGSLSLFGICVSAYFGYLSNKFQKKSEKLEIKAKNVEKELKTIKSRVRYDVSLSFTDWFKLYGLLNRLKEKTGMDRFLFLLAENGDLTELKLTNVKWEWHVNNLYKGISMGAMDRYVNVKIEPQYLQMVKTAEATGRLLIYDVAKMEDGQLKGYYLSEGVQHSLVGFLKRHIVTPEKHLVLYLSMATHREFCFNEAEMSEFELAHNTFKSLNYKFIEVKENTSL